MERAHDLTLRSSTYFEFSTTYEEVPPPPFYLLYFPKSALKRSLLPLRPHEAVQSLPSKYAQKMADVWVFLKYGIIKSDMSEGIQTNSSRRKIGAFCLPGIFLRTAKVAQRDN